MLPETLWNCQGCSRNDLPYDKETSEAEKRLHVVDLNIVRNYTLVLDCNPRLPLVLTLK